MKVLLRIDFEVTYVDVFMIEANDKATARLPRGDCAAQGEGL